MIKEPYEIILLSLIWIVCFGYFSYRVWFKPEETRAAYRNAILRRPDWYPLKSLALWYFETQAWLIFNRFVGLLGMLIGMGSLLIVLVK